MQTLKSTVILPPHEVKGLQVAKGKFGEHQAMKLSSGAVLLECGIQKEAP
jgi:hypothetical protein